ncbi:MAG: cadmium-translocating P-type ATPase [Clostridia bacterium]|jgi:Cd2+/Zn2+-exporting ATPase|nr:cadmium-translocating P-type ATPase [Clostridia bacterium]
MKKRGIKILLPAILYIIAIAVSFENGLINTCIFIVSYLIVGFDILKKALRNIIRGKVFDENFLMAVATLGAFGIGEFPEAVAVMLFYQVGELFQSYAVDKSRKSISSLMDIRPDFANLVKEDKIEKVDPDDVEIGNIIIVKPGEKVPLDGVVIEGISMIDTMALTGESVPRKVEVGNEILSGCINQNGLLKIKVAREYDESTVSKILELVENASNKKSKSENFITKFAKYYTPIVVIIAVILAFIPPIIFKDATFSDWIYRALSFLVVSCPCALVISIPLSFFGGIGGASKMGVLIKGSNYLEALANTEIVVFDKTGTLTKGVFEVQKIETEDISEDELIRISAYAENYSNHPIAQSIKKAYNKPIDEKLIDNTEELSGLGIIAQIEDKKVLVGNEKLMQKNNIKYKKCDDVGTILYVAINNEFKGFILISDKIKDDAFETIKKLKESNIKQTVMLTGDRKDVADDVAKKLSIDKVCSELLPDEKVKEVEKLLKTRSEKGKLAFVGDGINDAPVLAISDIGIAMGGLGSDAAIEASDIVIMTDKPSEIGNAIKLSKKTMRIVYQNIIFAIFVKVVVLILSALGLSTMWEAVFADVGVSMIAIINALRVLRGIK